jgi:hypothetical protein
LIHPPCDPSDVDQFMLIERCTHPCVVGQRREITWILLSMAEC